MTKFEELMSKREQIQVAMRDLETEETALLIRINAELEKEYDIVEHAFFWLKEYRAPEQMFDCASNETMSRYESFRHNGKEILIDLNYSYGYTDVIGLSDEEFQRLEKMYHNYLFK